MAVGEEPDESIGDVKDCPGDLAMGVHEVDRVEEVREEREGRGVASKKFGCSAVRACQSLTGFTLRASSIRIWSLHLLPQPTTRDLRRVMVPLDGSIGPTQSPHAYLVLFQLASDNR